MAVQLVTVAMLMRSVALDRWITVAASLLLLAASSAAVRGRTWGVAVAYLIGITFMTLCGLGIAPLFFALLGALAIRPFARVFRHLLDFDRGAAATLAVGATALGGAAGLAWKGFAHSLFNAFPAFVPSLYPHHGWLVAAIGAASTLLILRQHRAAPRERGETRTRVSEDAETHVRIAEDAETEADEAIDHEAEPRRLRA
jgi:hypothetical protein